MPSTRAVVTTDSIEYTKDNLFDIPFQTLQDELLNIANELKTLLTSEQNIKSHSPNPRITAIQTLKEILNPTLTNNPSLPRVTNNEDSPELIDKEYSEQHLPESIPTQPENMPSPSKH